MTSFLSLEFLHDEIGDFIVRIGSEHIHEFSLGLHVDLFGGGLLSFGFQIGLFGYIKLGRDGWIGSEFGKE